MRPTHSTWLIWISFVPALVLALLPLPAVLEYARPAWIPLFLIFWMITTPTSVGLVSAWCLGILLDILTGVLLGQYALAMLLTALATTWLQKRMVRASLPEQLLLLIPLILIYQLTYLWIGVALDQIQPNFYYLIPVFTSLIAWPPIHFLLSKLRSIYVIR